MTDRRFVMSWLCACALALTACGGGGGGTPLVTATTPGSSGTTATSPGAATSTPTSGSSAPAASPSATATPLSGGTPAASPTASAIATATATPASVGAAAVPFAPSPDADAFYAQPSPFPNGAPGTILASRMVTYAPVGGAAMQNAAYELKFVSRDTNGNPIAAVATVVLPLTPVANGPTPLLAVALAEDGLGAQCAPSHDVTGSTVDSTEQAEGTIPAQGQALGWVLVYPDYEGPQSAYGSGPLAGYITLDSIRAAENFAPAGLGANTPVGITGYSGGAFAAAWSATLEASYAPALKIVGIASGGTPADPKSIVSNIDTNQVSNAAFFSLIFAAVIGVNRSYPTIVTPILNAKGVAAATSLENGCLGATSNGAAAPTGTFPDYTTVADPLNAPNVAAVLPLDTLPQAGKAPIANVFVYHSQVDELIPISGADTMVAGWCAAGSTVAYYRGVTGDHIGFEATSASLAYAYLASRFEGLPTVTPPASTTCN